LLIQLVSMLLRLGSTKLSVPFSVDMFDDLVPLQSHLRRANFDDNILQTSHCQLAHKVCRGTCFALSCKLVIRYVPPPFSFHTVHRYLSMRSTPTRLSHRVYRLHVYSEAVMSSLVRYTSVVDMSLVFFFFSVLVTSFISVLSRGHTVDYFDN
jgi:hypothetical protein